MGVWTHHRNCNQEKVFIDCNSWLPIYVIVMLCCKSSCNHAALLKENGPKVATAAVEAASWSHLGFPRTINPSGGSPWKARQAKEGRAKTVWIQLKENFLPPLPALGLLPSVPAKLSPLIQIRCRTFSDVLPSVASIVVQNVFLQGGDCEQMTGTRKVYLSAQTDHSPFE